jgi:GNAT superfamily N-acetyltransferase
MPIRPATNADVAHMTELADAKRTEYEQYAPTFWRKAPNGAELQAPYFKTLITKDDVIALVHDEAGHIQGFIIASITTAPPVYDPGSQVIVVDDFTVSESEQWPTVGASLLEEARNRAAERGAALSIVVCGHLDEPKRAMLRACGFSLASEWYVNPA